MKEGWRWREDEHPDGMTLEFPGCTIIDSQSRLAGRVEADFSCGQREGWSAHLIVCCRPGWVCLGVYESKGRARRVVEEALEA